MVALLGFLLFCFLWELGGAREEVWAGELVAGAVSSCHKVPTLTPFSPYRARNTTWSTCQLPFCRLSLTCALCKLEHGLFQGTSVSVVLPALPVAMAKGWCGDQYYDVEITCPLPQGGKPLSKSSRPHLFVLAFALDEDRRLRYHQTSSAVPMGGGGHGGLNGEEGGGGGPSEELMWSSVKLRNSTEGGLRFRVPMDRTRVRHRRRLCFQASLLQRVHTHTPNPALTLTACFLVSVLLPHLSPSSKLELKRRLPTLALLCVSPPLCTFWWQATPSSMLPLPKGLVGSSRPGGPLARAAPVAAAPVPPLAVV